LLYQYEAWHCQKAIIWLGVSPIIFHRFGRSFGPYAPGAVLCGQSDRVGCGRRCRPALARKGNTLQSDG